MQALRTQTSSFVSVSSPVEITSQPTSPTLVEPGKNLQRPAQGIDLRAVETKLTDKFIAQLNTAYRDSYPQIGSHLKMILNLETSRAGFDRRQDDFNRIATKLSPEQTSALYRAKAQLQNILTMTFVNHDSITYAKEAARLKGSFDQASDFRNVLARLKKNNVSDSQLGDMLKKYGRMTLAITAHPTKPSSVEATQAESRLSTQINGMLQGAENSSELDQAIRDYISTPLVSKKKTPLDELEVGKISLTSMFHATPKVMDTLRQSLAAEGFNPSIANHLAAVTALIWIIGDGDGNPNMNPENLRQGLNDLKASVIDLYGHSLAGLLKDEDRLETMPSSARLRSDSVLASHQLIETATQEKGAFKRKCLPLPGFRSCLPRKAHLREAKSTAVDIKSRAETPEYQSIRAVYNKLAQEGYINSRKHEFDSDAFRKDLDALHAEVKANRGSDHPIAKTIQGLIDQVSTFGFTFAPVEMRHNARDLNSTINTVVKLAQRLEGAQGFERLNQHQRAQLMAKWIGNSRTLNLLKKAMGRITRENPESLQSTGISEKEGALARNIAGRLAVMGRHPNHIPMLIEAETEGPSDVMAALLLAKLTGSAIGDKGAIFQNVPLFESIPDLLQNVETLKTMLSVPEYRQHLAQTGGLQVNMHAGSDNYRTGGPASVIVRKMTELQLFQLQNEIRQMYPQELGNFTIALYQGSGGEHEQRSGGLPAEQVPARHADAARGAGATDIGPSRQTIQGQHAHYKYMNADVAANSMLAGAAQQLNAAAEVHGLAPPLRPAMGSNPETYRLLSVFADAALAAYRNTFGDLTGHVPEAKGNPAYNELLYNAPWLAVKKLNTSSRPTKRGVPEPTGPQSAREIIGRNPQALDQRAISSREVSQRTGIHVIFNTGLREGMLAVYRDAEQRGQSGAQALHNLFEHEQVFRDLCTVTAEANFDADPHRAWNLLLDKPRPDGTKLVDMAAKFRHTSDPNVNDPEHTLADLDVTYSQMATLLDVALTGQDLLADQKDIPLCKDPKRALKQLFPSYAVGKGRLNARTRWPHHEMARLNKQALRHPDEKLSDSFINDIVTLGIGSNIISHEPKLRLADMKA